MSDRGPWHAAPQPHDAPPPASHRRPRRRWLPPGTVWVALTVLSLGLLAPFVFAYAVARRPGVPTVATAVVFLGLNIALWTAPVEAAYFDFVLFGNLVASICVALALRPYVFRTREQYAYGVEGPAPKARPWPPHVGAAPPEPGPQQPSSGQAAPPGYHPAASPPGAPGTPDADPRATNAHLHRHDLDRQARRREARDQAHRDPAAAVDLGIGRPDRHTGYDDGGLIDLNRAPGPVLAHLPGLEHRHVEALLQTREELGPFVSLADAMIRADLPAHLEPEIAEYAIVF